MRLTQENDIDTLLKNSFFSLHIQSIAEVNKILEENLEINEEVYCSVQVVKQVSVYEISNDSTEDFD